MMAKMPERILLKDATLREGLDTPHVEFSIKQRLKIADLLDMANVPEVEIVAPGNVYEDLKFAKRLKEKKPRMKTSGLVYAYSTRCREEIENSSKHLDRFDLLMPLSEKRKPYHRDSKIACLVDILGHALKFQQEFDNEFLPLVLFAGSKDEENLPLLTNRLVEEETRIYVCQNKTCQLPVNKVSNAIAQMVNK